VFSRIIALCITAASLISNQLSPPPLQHYSFTSTESKILPGKTADNKRNSISAELDQIGPLALVALKYQNGHWTDGRYNHNDFPVEIGTVQVVGQEQRFEAFRLGEPLQKASKFLGSRHTIYYRFQSKGRWVLYRLDDKGVSQVTTIVESEINPGQHTRIMGLGASTVKGSATYFLAPEAMRVSNYPQLNPRVEATRLTNTPLGQMLVYRHAVDGVVPDARQRDSQGMTRQFFMIKEATGPAVIWQDKKNLQIQLTRFSADLQHSTSIILAMERPGRLLAACSDPSGNLYYLLAREKNDPEILELAKTDTNGKLLARFVPDSTRNGLNIYSMKAEAAELAWSKGQICMMLMRTMHKWADGLNHQGGIAVMFDANNLKQLKNHGQITGHSLDNVLSVNAAGEFIGADLGDNYPRGIHLHKLSDKRKDSRVVYTFKTSHGQTATNPAGKVFPPYPEISRPDKTFYKWSNDNNTYSELGGIAETAQGYMVIFSGEPSPEGRVLDNSRLGPDKQDKRNIGLVVAVKDFHRVPSNGTAIPDALLLTKGITETGGFYGFNGNWYEQRSTGVVWLTNYPANDNRSAYNVKTARLPDGNILILWKTYRPDATNWAMTVSADGTQLIAPFRLPDQLFLNRRDAIMVDGNRVYIPSGHRNDKRLELFVLQLT
jgi:hypothetical protein